MQYSLGPFPPAARQLFNPNLHAPLPEPDPELLWRQHQQYQQHQQHQQQHQHPFGTAYNPHAVYDFLSRCEPGPEPLRGFSPPARPTAPRRSFTLRPPPASIPVPVMVPALQQADQEVFVSSPPTTPSSISSSSSGSWHPTGTPYHGAVDPPLVSRPAFSLGPLPVPFVRSNDIQHGHSSYGHNFQNQHSLPRIPAEQPMTVAGFVSDSTPRLRRPSGPGIAHMQLPSLGEVLSQADDEHVPDEGLVRLPPIARTPTRETFGQDGYKAGWSSPMASQPNYCEVSGPVEAMATPSQGMLTPVTDMTQLAETPTEQCLDMPALSSPGIPRSHAEDTFITALGMSTPPLVNRRYGRHSPSNTSPCWQQTEHMPTLETNTVGQTTAHTPGQPTLDPSAWEILYSAQAEETAVPSPGKSPLPSDELPTLQVDMTATPVPDTAPLPEDTPSPYVPPSSSSADSPPPEPSMSFRPHCCPQPRTASDHARNCQTP